MRSDRGIVTRGLRVIASYAAMHPLSFTVAVAGATVYGLATVGTAVVTGQVTDRVLLPAFEEGGVTPAAALTGAGAILLVGLMRGLGVGTRRAFAYLNAVKVGASLRRRLADQYRELPLAYHKARPTGQLIAHGEADVLGAIEVIHPTPFALAVTLMTVVAAVVLVATDPLLAVVAGLVLPTLVLLNREYSRRAEDPAARVQARIGDVSTVAHESIDGALVVKTLGREEAEVARLAREAEALRAARVEVGWLRAGFTPAFEALPVVGMILLLAVGTWRISTGALTVGTLVQFVVLFQLLAFPIAIIGHALSEVPRSVVSRERLERVFTEPVTRQEPADSLPLPPGPLAVSVRDVGYGPSGRRLRGSHAEGGRSTGGQKVLDGLSFEVAPATAVALVGATGSGKSTLAELLVRLSDPEEGSIELGGVDLRHLDPGALRAATALVFQESFLFASTVRENITLGAGFPDAAVRRAARVAQAERFVDALPDGLDTVVGERGVTLSGGQRQRIALARALVREPRLLILDDATAAVDPTIEAEILAGLRRELETTLVMVAYRTSAIALADQVLFLEGGRVAATGTHRELLGSRPAYAAMTSAYERGRR